MLESTIELVLEKDEFTSKIFKGAIAIDELPKNIEYPSCFIINNKPRSNKGEHWVAVLFDLNKTGYFFDSYGENPSKYNLKTFMNKSSIKWYWNKKRIQGILPYCGYYSILYLLYKSWEKSHEFFKFFDHNYIINDLKILHMIKKQKNII